MADNLSVTPGSGATVRAVEKSSIKAQTVTVDIGGAGAEVLLTGSMPVRGSTANDSASDGYPVLFGGKATNSGSTPVGDGDIVQLLATLTGKLVVMPFAVPEMLFVGSTSGSGGITTTTSTSIVSAPGSGLRNFITHIIVTCSHATVGTLVNIQDGNGGTVLYKGYAAPAGGGFSISLPVPIRQPTANTAIYVACSTTGSAIHVSISGYKGI